MLLGCMEPVGDGVLSGELGLGNGGSTRLRWCSGQAVGSVFKEDFFSAFFKPNPAFHPRVGSPCGENEC